MSVDWYLNLKRPSIIDFKPVSDSGPVEDFRLVLINNDLDVFIHTPNTGEKLWVNIKPDIHWGVYAGKKQHIRSPAIVLRNKIVCYVYQEFDLDTDDYLAVSYTPDRGGRKRATQHVSIGRR